MERRNEILIFILALAILFIGFTFFDGSSSKTGQLSIRRFSGDCGPGWFCVDSNTRAYRTDSCSITQQTNCGLNEICTNGQCVQVTHKACVNNACTIVQGPGSDECVTNADCQQNRCNDTDGGINYFVQGTVSGVAGGNPYSYTDQCVPVSQLQEWYCAANGSATYGYYTCNSGYICLNGACINSTSRVFVTSIEYNGNLGGVSGADQKCQERANAAGLGGNWKAWISSTASSAASRLYHNTLPYVRLGDEAVVANNWNDLIDGSLNAPINRNEFGLQEAGGGFGSGYTFTGTSVSGGYAIGLDCQAWTTDTASFGLVGLNYATNYSWTAAGHFNCGTMNGIYCFEQP